MTFILDNLIHFLARSQKAFPTRQFEVFKKIIENGIRTAEIQIRYGDGQFVYNEAICFTDIPLRDCDEHTTTYGKFGIGFKKAFVKEKGGNPARYFLDYLPGEKSPNIGIESRGALNRELHNQFQFLKLFGDRKDLALTAPNGEVIKSSNELEGLYQALLFTFSFDKEMGDLGPPRDGTAEIDLYYKEREWRLVPSTLNLRSGIIRKESESERYLYSFKRSDVNVIVVPNDELRGEVLKYLQSFQTSTDERLKEFANAPPPIINYDDLHQW